MKDFEKLGSLLPLGYLYLVVLGIIKEAIFFYQIGINYLNYSSVMDILLSPVATIMSHPVFLLGIIFFIVLMYLYSYYAFRVKDKKWRKFLLGKKYIDKELNPEEQKTEMKNFFINFIAFGMLSFFLGIGVGNGSITKKRIKENSLKIKHRIHLNSGETADIHLIASNALYYFYVPKNSKTVTITPVNSVKSLEIIDNRMLK